MYRIAAGGNQLHLGSITKAESGESECQYSYTAIKEYLRAVVYPDGYDKQSKRGLRKRSKYFTLEGGHLMYIGKVMLFIDVVGRSELLGANTFVGSLGIDLVGS